MHTRCRLLLALFLASLVEAHAAPGDLDPLDPDLVGSFVAATAVQPDGRIIIAGRFTSVLGVPRSHIARLNADGTLDMGFDPKVNGGDVVSVAVQSDGKVLLGGDFTTLQPNDAPTATFRARIARVNADGTLDTGFDPQANNGVLSVAVQADGQVLLSGYFTALQPNGAPAPATRERIARLNADGTLDTSFDPRANGTVNCVVVQADGKVLLGGYFSTLQPNGAPVPTARSRIARVNANGTLDTGFDPSANSVVFCVAEQSDGKVLLGGAFTTLQPNGAGASTAHQRVARVNADGTLDSGFGIMADGSVHSVAVQADGKVLLGGAFTALQSTTGAGEATAHQRIARINADGTLDTSFDPKANDIVYSMAVQADGKWMPGGLFTSIQPDGAGSPTTRHYFARLQNDPASQFLAVPDATQILWHRSGAAPELSRVTFEVSNDSGTSWIILGPGTRIGTTPNWQRTGLALPHGSQLRARGVTSGGYRNGSSGLIEQIATFSTDADNDDLLDTWELTWWPTTAGHGPHDDDDHDGYDNLVELAFGLNPTIPDAHGLPSFTTKSGYLTVSITKQPGAAYEVQTAASPMTDSFTAATTTVLINDATTLEVRDNFPISSGPRRFLRVKVTAAP